MATVKIFDASLQKEVDYDLEVDQNGEIVATSTESDNVLKFPAGMSKKDFEKALAKHKAENEGHEVITPEMIETEQKQLDKSHDLLKNYE